MTKLMNQKKLKMIMFIIDIPRFGNDYIVDSLSKRYQTTKGIIMQNLKMIGQSKINDILSIH